MQHSYSSPKLDVREREGEGAEWVAAGGEVDPMEYCADWSEFSEVNSGENGGADGADIVPPPSVGSDVPTHPDAGR